MGNCKTDLFGQLLGFVKKQETWQSLHWLNFRSPAPSILNAIKFCFIVVKIIYWSVIRPSQHSENLPFTLGQSKVSRSSGIFQYSLISTYSSVLECQSYRKRIILEQKDSPDPSRQALIQEAWSESNNEVDYPSYLLWAIAWSTPINNEKFKFCVHEPSPTRKFLLLIWTSEGKIQNGLGWSSKCA